MRTNRRETISLLASAAPAALGVLSIADITNPGHAQEAKPSMRVVTTGQNPSQKIDTRIGRLEFTHDFANGYPTDATIEKLYDERDFQRANLIPTVPGKNWFAYFRFYQPTEAYFDRSWPLPDFEQV